MTKQTQDRPTKKEEQNQSRTMGPFCTACQNLTPTFADMVADRTRDRISIIIGMSFLFFLIVLDSRYAVLPNHTLEQLVFAAPPQATQSLGTSCGRAPRLFAQLASNSVPDVGSPIAVKVELAQLVIPDPTGTLDCSTGRLNTLKNTLEALRYEKPCATNITDHTNTTDRAGVINFDRLGVDGPAGEYTLRFQAVDTTVSVSKSIKMVPIVRSINAINRFSYNDGTNIPKHLPQFQTGVALARQPKIQVFGSQGKPLSGAVVTAFAWHAPFFVYSQYEGGKLQPSDKGDVPFPGHRLATLSGAVSEPSTEDGVAAFTNLTITGTTSDVVYLHFYCQGSLASWSAPTVFQLPIRNPVFHQPLMIQHPSAMPTVQILVNLPTTVVEGATMPTAKVQLNPAVQGKLVFAVIQSTFNERIEPYYYDTPTGLPDIGRKRLMHAVGVTDDQGVATFDKLTFQRSGPSGTYTVRFVCDGVWSSTISTVQVTSSVHAVVVLNKHVAIPLAHQFVLSSEGDGNVVQKVAKFILRALDNKGNGVAGKIVQVELYKNDTGTLVLEDPAIAGIALQIAPAPEKQDVLSSYTGQDGFVTTNIFFTHVPKIPLNLTQPSWFFKFNVDDGAGGATSTLVGPVVNSPSSTASGIDGLPTSIQFTRKPTQITIGEPFDIEVQVRTKSGQAPDSLMSAVICQNDYRPFYNPFAIGVYGEERSFADPGMLTLKKYHTIYPCKYQKDNPPNHGCLDNAGKLHFNLTVWGAPAPHRPQDNSFDLGYHVLLLSSNASAWPRETSPFFKFYSDDNIVDNLDTMCRLSGSYPDNTVTVGPFNKDYPEIVLAASSNHVSTKVYQPIHKIRLDGTRTENYVLNKPVKYTSMDPLQKYHRVTSNELSPFAGGSMESFFLFYKVLDDNFNALKAKGAGNAMTIRMLHAPSSMSHLSYIFGRQSSPIEHQVMNGVFADEGSRFGGSSTPMSGGQYFDGKRAVFNRYGNMDNNDPSCADFCVDVPWMLEVHPLQGASTVDKNNAGKDFGNDAVFWMQQVIIFPGKYVFQIDIDGVRSDIVGVETSPQVSRLEIVQQPKTSRLGNTPARPGDLFEQQPIVRVLKQVYDSNGVASYVPRGLVKVSAMFVNDDMTAAPALADLIEQPSKEFDVDDPWLPKVGTFSSSTPSARTGGHATFTSVSFLSGRTGCYRMIFYVGDAKPDYNNQDLIETVFAGSKDSTTGRWVPTMSERVCLLNEETIKVGAKPSSIASLGATLQQAPLVKAIYKRSYVDDSDDDFDELGNRCYAYKKLFLREMEVQMYSLLMHNFKSNRKLEPSLQEKVAKTMANIQGQVFEILSKNNTHGTQTSHLAQADSLVTQTINKMNSLKDQIASLQDLSVDDQLNLAVELSNVTKTVIGLLAEAGNTFRGGDTRMGALLSNAKTSNAHCPVYFDYNVSPMCKQQNERPSDGNANRFDVSGAAILYDISDGSIKLVFDCEYRPLVVNAYKSFHDGNTDPTTNSPWPAYHQQCIDENRVDTDVGRKQGMKWRLDGGIASTVFPIRGSQLGYYEKNQSKTYGTPNWFGKNARPQQIEIDFGDFGNGNWQDLNDIFHNIFEPCIAMDRLLHPVNMEAANTNLPQPGIPLVIGLTTHLYEERLDQPVEKIMNFANFQIKKGENLERIKLKPMDSLIMARHDAYNLQSEPYDEDTIDQKCNDAGDGDGNGTFADCCSTNNDCQSNLVCHPVEFACTTFCGGEPTVNSARRLFQTPQCEEEPLSQRKTCSQIKPSVAKKFLDNLNGRIIMNEITVSGDSGQFWSSKAWTPYAPVPALHLCSAKKAIGTSFAPFCTTCRNISLAYTETDPLAPKTKRFVVPTQVKHMQWSGANEIDSADSQAKVLFDAAADLVGDLDDSLEDVAEAAQAVTNKVAVYCNKFPDTCSSKLIRAGLVELERRLKSLCTQLNTLVGGLSTGLQTLCNLGVSQRVLDIASKSIKKVQRAGAVISAGSAAAYALNDLLKTLGEATSNSNSMVNYANVDQMDPIMVSTQPANVYFITSPPSTIELGEVFIVSVRVEVKGGAPLIGFKTLIEISDVSLAATSPQDFFASSSGEVSKKQEATFTEPKLSKARTVAYTNADGIAKFTVVVESGVRGDYTLTANAGDLKSLKSSQFELTNRIHSIVFMPGFGQTITINPKWNLDLNSGAKGVVCTEARPCIKYFDPQPTVRLLNRAGQAVALTPDMKLEWRIEKYVPPLTNLANRAESVRKAWPQLNAVEQFTQFFTVLTQGARRMKLLPTPRPRSSIVLHMPGSNGTMTQPGDTNNLKSGNITWKGLKLLAGENEGNYTVLLVVDGVVSEFSEPIYLVSIEVNQYLEDLINTMVQIVCFCLAGLSMIGSSTWHSKYYLIVSFATGIVVAACTKDILTEKALPGREDEMTGKQIILYICAGCMILITSKMTVTEIKEYMKAKNSKKQDPKQANGSAIPHHAIREEREGPHTPAQCCCYVFADRRRYSYFRYTRRMVLGMTKHEKAVERSVQSCLEKYYTGDNDAFYFPQRVLTACVLSFFAQMYIFYYTIVQVDDVVTSVANMANTALQTSFLGITKSVDLYDSLFAQELYDQSQDVIPSIKENGYFLFDQFVQMSQELKYALYIAFSLSVMVYIASWYATLVDFKQQCIAARTGTWSFDKNQVRMGDAANWGGLAVANGILSHYYFTAIFGCVAFIFTWQRTRALIVYAIFKLYTIWVPIVVLAIYNSLVKKFFVYTWITNQKGDAGDRIILRKWFHMYDLWMFFTQLGTSFITALTRFIIAIAVALFTLPRTNVSPLPSWIERYTALDTGSKSFNAVIKLYNEFNQPVFNVACWLLEEESKDRRLQHPNDDAGQGSKSRKPTNKSSGFALGTVQKFSSIRAMVGRTLTPQEVRNRMKRFPPPPTRVEWQSFMKERNAKLVKALQTDIDEDGDGKLTRDEFDDYMAKKYQLESRRRRAEKEKKQKSLMGDGVVVDVELVTLNVKDQDLTHNPMRASLTDEKNSGKPNPDVVQETKEAEDNRTEEEKMINDMGKKFKKKYIDPDDLSDEALPTMRSGLGAARWQLAVMLIKYPLLRKYRRHRLLETLAFTDEHSSNKWTEGADAEQKIREQARSIASLRPVSRTASVVRRYKPVFRAKDPSFD